MGKSKEVLQVAGQVELMEDELTRLKEEIDTLRNRLGSVLKERQVGIGNEEEVVPLLVPLANSLRDCTKKVFISTSEIIEIINLLEV